MSKKKPTCASMLVVVVVVVLVLELLVSPPPIDNERGQRGLSHALSASAKKKSDSYFALSPSDEGLFSATEEPYLVGKTLSLYFHTYIHTLLAHRIRL